MKLLGVERIISVSAVGSLKEDFRPENFSFRISSLTGPRIASLLFSEKESLLMWRLRILPAASCRAYWRMLAFMKPSKCIGAERTSASKGRNFHAGRGGVHRQLRFEVIGMTNVTEARLAREAEICYATDRHDH